MPRSIPWIIIIILILNTLIDLMFFCLFICFCFFFSQELYNDCDKLRQTVFQLATETEDNDSSLGEKSSNLALLMLMIACASLSTI